MVSVENAVVARLKKGNEEFEILVDPEKALDFRKGKPVGIANILAVNEVFKNVKKGERHTSSTIQAAFNTTDMERIAGEIIRNGEVQLTTNQRRALVEEKRKEIADIISRQGVNPQTKLPHPPNRIINAMEKARLVVDPFLPANEQVRGVIEKIKDIIPISIEQVEIAIRVPMEFAGRASSVLHNMVEVKKEEWKADAWLAWIEIPAGRQTEIYDKLNSLTGGRVEVKVTKKEA